MKNITAWFVLIIVILIAALAIVAYEVEKPASATPPGTSATSTTSGLNNQVSYSCLGGKTINADYTDNNVSLVLSDGRTISLPQVASGSGIRYEQSTAPGQLTTFSSDGNNAFLTENGTITYNNCVAGTTTTGTNATGIVDGMTTYTDASKTFSFSYPASVTVSGGGVGYDTDWKQEATTTGLLLAVAVIPQTFEPHTNFVDGKFTVGTSPDPQAVASCLSEGNGNPVTSSKVNINGIPFTKLTFSDAGAGNFYDTTSYRTVRNSQCYAIEYTIHSSNIANYPPNSGVTQFDELKVKNTLDGIVQSFKFY